MLNIYNSANPENPDIATVLDQVTALADQIQEDLKVKGKGPDIVANFKKIKKLTYCFAEMDVSISNDNIAFFNRLIGLCEQYKEYRKGKVSKFMENAIQVFKVRLEYNIKGRDGAEWLNAKLKQYRENRGS